MLAYEIFKGAKMFDALAHAGPRLLSLTPDMGNNLSY